MPRKKPSDGLRPKGGLENCKNFATPLSPARRKLVLAPTLGGMPIAGRVPGESCPRHLSGRAVLRLAGGLARGRARRLRRQPAHRERLEPPFRQTAGREQEPDVLDAESLKSRDRALRVGLVQVWHRFCLR